MSDRLVTFLLKIALMALDKWLDDLIANSDLSQEMKAKLGPVEAKLITVLEGPFGREVAKTVGRAILKSKFGNDPSTGNWA